MSATEVVVEGDDVYEAMGELPQEMLRRFGRPVPFTVVRIEQAALSVDDETGPVRVTAVARP